MSRKLEQPMKIDKDEEGNEVITYLCTKCSKFRKPEKYPEDNRWKICSDCFANDYKDDLAEFVELYQKMYEIRKIPKEKLQEILGENFEQVNKLFDKLEIGYSDDLGEEEQLVEAN